MPQRQAADASKTQDAAPKNDLPGGPDMPHSITVPTDAGDPIDVQSSGTSGIARKRDAPVMVSRHDFIAPEQPPKKKSASAGEFTALEHGGKCGDKLGMRPKPGLTRLHTSTSSDQAAPHPVGPTFARSSQKVQQHNNETTWSRSKSKRKRCRKRDVIAAPFAPATAARPPFEEILRNKVG
ncbi:hypothetical protein HPB50_029039 [Hyalomma asiaticum]|nr:hypothetical protein HPB50_029039 [Hyalomma asiaticum]